MSNIVMNQPCPACQETGHDKTGNHLMVFSDGNRLCKHAEYHKSGRAYFVPAGSDDPILEMAITGTVKYTEDQFHTLVEEGRLDSPAMRALALAGMRGQDAWNVASDEERAEMLKELEVDEKFFNQLPIRNLVSRHIRGQYAKFYNVHVGLGEDGKVDRHYYPAYSRETGNWQGAKCRTLPKDFSMGCLGWTWGDLLMFGQHTLQAVLESGRRMDTLLIVGGECDAMAAQQMLCESQAGTKWEGTWFHVWSVNKGECTIQELIANKDAINKFKKIIFAFDNDEAGNKLTTQAAKLFRDKAFKLKYPDGCKDANKALQAGKSKEFVDAWFNPVSPFEGGNIRSMKHYKEQAKQVIADGLSYPWAGLNPITYGMRLYSLVVLGAGSGVGKTSITKEMVYHLAYVHGKRVMVIYLEEPAPKTVRSFAGFPINKDLTAPSCHDKEDPYYNEMRDYTEEEANEAIDRLCEDDMIYIGDLEGRKDVDSVMELMEEGIAMGYEYFFVDNLTAFEHKGKDGKKVSSSEAIDETMKRIGTLKDENPIHVELLSHLNRPSKDDKPHEEGGEVRMTHFRGSGSITFWANAVFGAERNTKADTLQERCLTLIRAVKCRDAGHMTGTKVYLTKNLDTGRLLEGGTPPPPKAEKGKGRTGFDTHTPSKKGKPTDETEF